MIVVDRYCCTSVKCRCGCERNYGYIKVEHGSIERSLVAQSQTNEINNQCTVGWEFSGSTAVLCCIVCASLRVWWDEEWVIGYSHWLLDRLGITGINEVGVYTSGRVGVGGKRQDSE